METARKGKPESMPALGLLRGPAPCSTPQHLQTTDPRTSHDVKASFFQRATGQEQVIQGGENRGTVERWIPHSSGQQKTRCSTKRYQHSHNVVWGPTDAWDAHSLSSPTFAQPPRYADKCHANIILINILMLTLSKFRTSPCRGAKREQWGPKSTDKGKPNFNTQGARRCSLQKPPLGCHASSGFAGSRAPASRIPPGEPCGSQWALRMAGPAAPKGLPSPWRSGPTRCSSWRWWIGRAAAGTPWSRPLLCLHRVCKGAHKHSMGLDRLGLTTLCSCINGHERCCLLATQNVRENPPHPWNTGGSSEMGFIWTMRLGSYVLPLKKLVLNHTIYCFLHCNIIHFISLQIRNVQKEREGEKEEGRDRETQL